MEQDRKKDPFAGKDIAAKEVTSDMVKNASASGDGSINRSEGENIEVDKEERKKIKTNDDEGTF